MLFHDSPSQRDGWKFLYPGGVLVCVSASHRTAGFAVLERLSGQPPRAAELLWDPGVRGAVVVATCNRVEVYVDVDTPVGCAIDTDHVAVTHLLSRIAGPVGLTAVGLRPLTHQLTESRAAAHLFAVASGLESVVLGEVEVAGQIRRAVNAAREQGTMTPRLEQLFQMASSTSRQVRHRTNLNETGRSMVRLALDLAESRVADWRDTSVLLIGTGTYAGATFAALRARGVAELRVTSPSGREGRWASRDGASPVPFGTLRARVAEADLIVTSTNTLALEADQVADARADTKRPLLVVDLGMPANVATDVAHVAGVELLDLPTIARHTPVSELNVSARAWDEVERASDDFAAFTAQKQATPAIIAMREHADRLIAVELDRLRRRGEYSPTAERAVRHFAAMLLHTPITRARESAAAHGPDRFSQALEAMFGLEAGVSPTEQDGRAGELRAASN